MLSKSKEHVIPSPNQQTNIVIPKKSQDNLQKNGWYDEFYECIETGEYNLGLEQMDNEIIKQNKSSGENSPIIFQSVYRNVTIYNIVNVPIQMSEQICNILSPIYDASLTNDEVGRLSLELIIKKLKMMLDYEKIVDSFLLNLLKLLLQILSSSPFNQINLLQEDQHLIYLKTIIDNYQEYLRQKAQNDDFICHSHTITFELTTLESLESRLNRNSN